MADCLFCRIVRGEIPATIVARDAHAVAFLDVNPLADGHVLVIPTGHATLVEELTPDAAARLFTMVQRLAGPLREAMGAAGTTIGVNDGRITGQTVPHVHVHMVPRWEGDGAGSVHLLFRPQPKLTLADAAEKIRRALA